MYTKDKATRITLRLNDAQFNFVKTSSDVLGVSPSEFLRMVINQTMSLTSSQVVQAPAAVAIIESANDFIDDLGEGGIRRENEQANIDNIV